MFFFKNELIKKEFYLGLMVVLYNDFIWFKVYGIFFLYDNFLWWIVFNDELVFVVGSFVCEFKVVSSLYGVICWFDVIICKLLWL